ncbi:hypothetical protein Bca4012_010990 [Brassica carinata]
MLGSWDGCHGKGISSIFLADYLATCKESSRSVVLSIYIALTQVRMIFCGLGMRNKIGQNKVKVEKRCSNH